jgi:hypothetical protein
MGPGTIAEETHCVMILRALMSMLADQVLDSVAMSRRMYLTEFSRFLDERGFIEPQADLEDPAV